MTDRAPGELPGTRQAKGPAPGYSYHSFCPNCRRVVYNVWKHGPLTPYDQNRTFCVCNGEATGMVEQRVTIYDVEDLKKK